MQIPAFLDFFLLKRSRLYRRWRIPRLNHEVRQMGMALGMSVPPERSDDYYLRAEDRRST